MLREKERLHWIVQRLDERDIRAGVQFAVLAIVVLPLLPTGPFLVSSRSSRARSGRSCCFSQV
jgi:uncharacterized membrane protein (DUF4010 family)